MNSFKIATAFAPSYISWSYLSIPGKSIVVSSFGPGSMRSKIYLGSIPGTSFSKSSNKSLRNVLRGERTGFRRA